jgi:hypothetical protein
MTKSHPAGGARTLIGLLSTFALVGGVVGFQNAAAAELEAQRPVEPIIIATPTPVPTAEAPAKPKPRPAINHPAPVVKKPTVHAKPARPRTPSGTTGGSGN